MIFKEKIVVKFYAHELKSIPYGEEVVYSLKSEFSDASFKDQ